MICMIYTLPTLGDWAPILQWWAEGRSSVSVKTWVVTARSQGLLPPHLSRQQGKTCLLHGTFLLPLMGGGEAAADLPALTAVIIADYRFLTFWAHMHALLGHVQCSWCLPFTLALRGSHCRGGGFFEESHLCSSPTSSDGPQTSPVTSSFAATILLWGTFPGGLAQPRYEVRGRLNWMPPWGWLRDWWGLTDKNGRTQKYFSGCTWHRGSSALDTHTDG